MGGKWHGSWHQISIKLIKWVVKQSVGFLSACSVVKSRATLRPRGLQHTWLPCPSLSPGVCSDSRPLSRRCHPTISSSVAPSFPALNLSQHWSLFQWVSQSTGASASASVLPMNAQDWFPLQLTGLISLLSKGLSRVFSNSTVEKHQFFVLSFLYSPTVTFIHDYWKITALTRRTFVGKVMSLLFNMLSWFVIAFLPRSKCLFISRLQSLFVVILEPKKIKSVTVSIVSPSICHEVLGPDAIIFIFWMLSFRSSFSLSSLLSSRGSLVLLHFLP